MIVFARRLEAGSPTSVVNMSVGADNRRLVVTGGCTRSLYRSNESPRLYARAAWDEVLTALRVEARIRSETGFRTTVTLVDGGPLTVSGGSYTADLPPLRVGHYSGVVSLAAAARRPRADQLHMVTHTRAARLSARTSAPRFQRQIAIRFAVTKGR